MDFLNQTFSEIDGSFHDIDSVQFDPDTNPELNFVDISAISIDSIIGDEGRVIDMRNGVVELTRGGNKKGPGYQLLVDWCSEAWAAIDKDLIIRSFVQTGVTNTGVLEVANLHTNLKDLLEGNVEVEVIQQELEEEVSTGLTDNEDSDDDVVVEDSEGF